MGHIFLPYIAPSTGGVVFTDNFNRADEDIEDSSNWEILATTGPASIVVEVASNEFSSSSSAGTMHETNGYTGTIAANHYAQVEVVSIPSTDTNEIAVLVRGTFTDLTERNFYSFGYSTAGAGTYRIVRRNEGGVVPTSVLDSDAGPGAPTAGDILRFEANGTSLVGKVNGATVCTATDANLTTGKPGIYTFFSNTGKTTLLDNFECGEL